MKKILGWSLIVLIMLIIFAFFIDGIVNRNPKLHLGKDDGLVFRILAMCTISSFIFFIKNKKISFLIIGFFVSLLSYIAVFFFYIVISFLIYGDTRGLNVPLLVDQLIVSVFISLFFIKIMGQSI